MLRCPNACLTSGHACAGVVGLILLLSLASLQPAQAWDAAYDLNEQRKFAVCSRGAGEGCSALWASCVKYVSLSWIDYQRIGCMHVEIACHAAVIRIRLAAFSQSPHPSSPEDTDG